MKEAVLLSLLPVGPPCADADADADGPFENPVREKKSFACASYMGIDNDGIQG